VCLQTLARFTVELDVPADLSPQEEDKLCKVLDLIDLRNILEQETAFRCRQNKVLSKYVVNVKAEE
jgi:hypothetical protein